MDWHESAAKGMPPPNPDEPASLRRDIADELGDHLACSFAREREHTGDEETARRAVLDRFGDPRRIARRLWLDAMKEVIMNQRTLLTTCIILAAACVATATFSFLSLRHTQQANEALQKANVAVLAKLEDLSKQTQAISPWSHLTVRVRRGTEVGPAVEGIVVALQGKPYSESEEILRQKTDSGGQCRFGPMRAGRYVLTVGQEYPVGVKRADDKKLPFYSRRSVMLYPSEQEQTFSYPDVPMTKIGFAPEWPSKFKDEDLVFCCNFEFKMPQDWLFYQTAPVPQVPFLNVYFDRNGELYERSGTWQGMMKMALKKSQPAQRFASQLALDARATSIWILRRVGDGPTTAPYELVAHYTKEQVPSSQQGSPAYPFSAKPDIENVWKITLPAQLIQDTRSAIPEWQVFGRVIRTMPVEKDGGAYVDNVAGGRRTFAKWADIPKEEAESVNRRFVLALYSIETTTGTIPPSQILVHEIVEDWPEESLPTGVPMPKWSPVPAARFDFEPSVGWKMFDMTELVRSQARYNRPNLGILLRFEREDVKKVDYAPGADNRRQWSAYLFVTKLLAPHQLSHKHPCLLVVEPKK